MVMEEQILKLVYGDKAILEARKSLSSRTYPGYSIVIDIGKESKRGSVLESLPEWHVQGCKDDPISLGFRRCLTLMQAHAPFIVVLLPSKFCWPEYDVGIAYEQLALALGYTLESLS